MSIWSNLGNMAGNFLGNTAGGLLDKGVGLLGSFFSNKWASQEAQKNRDWQENMSNTSHQRQVADLRKAGLNPILSATGGSGASSGGGGQATISDMGAGYTNASRLSMDKKVSKSNIKNMEQERNESLSRENLNSIEGLKKGSEMNNLYEQGLNLQAEREKIYNDIANSKVLTNAQAFNLIHGSKSSSRSAEASYINATQGSAWKTGAGLIQNTSSYLLSNPRLKKLLEKADQKYKGL